MRRRDFIKVIAGSAVALPLTARAQQAEQVRRVGVLMNRSENDPEGQARLAAFKQALQQLGWSDGRNMQIDIRWGEDDINRARSNAAELVALTPDIILASGTVSMTALQHLNLNLPIVFTGVGDPIGAGFDPEPMQSPIASAGAHRRNVTWAAHDMKPSHQRSNHGRFMPRNRQRCPLLVHS